MTRLSLNDDYVEAVKKISEGNPGAIRVIMQCYEKSFLCGQLVVAELDIKEIYGSKIWQLYKDECGEDLDKFILKADPDNKEKVANLKRVGLDINEF